MQRELARLADGASEDAQGHPGQRRACQDRTPGGQRLRRLPNVGNMEGVEPRGGEVVGL